jgi:very-short-patch-repair endonuclease
MKPELIERQRLNSKYRERLIANATPEENIVREYLDSHGIKYVFQKGFLQPFHRIIDFYICKPYRIILEIDGGYHNNPTTKHFDAYKDKTWGRFQTVRLTNNQINNAEYKQVLNYVLKLPN